MEHHIKDLKIEVEENKSLVVQCQLHIKKVTLVNKELKTENDKLLNENTKVKTENNSLKEENCSLISKINYEPSKKRKISENDKKIESSTENKKLDELKTKYEELGKTNRKYLKDLKDLNEKNKKLKNEINSFRKKYDEVKQVNTTLEVQIQNFHSIPRDPRLLRNMSLEKDKKIKELEEAINSLQNRIKLKDDSSNVDLSIVKLEKDENLNYIEDLKSYENKLADYKRSQSLLEDAIRKKNIINREAETKISDLESEINSKVTEIQKLTNDITCLEKKMSEINIFVDDMKNEKKITDKANEDLKISIDNLKQEFEIKLNQNKKEQKKLEQDLIDEKAKNLMLKDKLNTSIEEIKNLDNTLKALQEQYEFKRSLCYLYNQQNSSLKKDREKLLSQNKILVNQSMNFKDQHIDNSYPKEYSHNNDFNNINSLYYTQQMTQPLSQKPQEIYSNLSFIPNKLPNQNNQNNCVNVVSKNSLNEPISSSSVKLNNMCLRTYQQNDTLSTNAVYYSSSPNVKQYTHSNQSLVYLANSTSMNVQPNLGMMNDNEDAILKNLLKK